MATRFSKYGFIGIVFGGLALMIVLMNHYAGPRWLQPTLEEVVAERATAIRDATVAALKGEEPEQPSFFDRLRLDEVLPILGSGLGGLAIICGVVGFARNESMKPATGAILLGVGAIAFPLVIASQQAVG